MPQHRHRNQYGQLLDPEDDEEFHMTEAVVNKAHNPISDANRKPLGCYQSAELSTAVGAPSLSSATNPTIAIIQAIGNDVSWRDDGTTATVSSGGTFGGMILAAGDSFLYVGQLDQLSFIEATSGSNAYINIAYYA